jgi:hypothetical protein
VDPGVFVSEHRIICKFGCLSQAGRVAIAYPWQGIVPGLDRQRPGICERSFVPSLAAQRKKRNAAIRAEGGSMKTLLAGIVIVASYLPAPAQELTLRAGELLSCNLEEPNFSSATAELGEPVVCYLSQFREFGHSAFPRGSYLAGRLADYKDPGRLVGKGWLSLEFDRLILPDTEVPISTQLVSVQHFKLDSAGRIQGQGHATRDAVAWFVPVLWPVQLMRLPGRGPRPVLRGEVPLTVRPTRRRCTAVLWHGTRGPCRVSSKP